VEFNSFDMASTEVKSVKPTLDGVVLRDSQLLCIARPTSYTKGSQKCGPFSFGYLECVGNCVDSIEDLLDRDERGWSTLIDRERLKTQQIITLVGLTDISYMDS
jgi:hypothetical protein